MKIGEARKTYSAPLREFWEEKKSLAKQKKALDEKIKATPSGQDHGTDHGTAYSTI